MLNRSTLDGRQTQMGSRRVVGANLVPTLVRLAECADPDLSYPARSLVLALYGEKLTPRVRHALNSLTSEEVETMLDVMSERRITLSEAAHYLTTYFGPPRECSDVGWNTLAAIRDADGPSSDIATRLLRMDLLGQLPPPVRLRLVDASPSMLRGLCDELAEHTVSDAMLVSMLEGM